ncbi:hypothetical protein [Cohnella herbarum]|uniref:Beta-galactosidase trimerisation domain-containing protein n=1 Tax=Cohnella herbarum TaxID=2728023 RepID=A0A7Z2ZMG9_9BACL|nr:hypothetical protein [Cohnella herbarum]QJD84964.1 hypothetical protein HH215_18435 [Cohnella herbarum]
MERANPIKRLNRVTLEMSLKPFTSMEPSAIEAVCEEAIRQWMPLIGMADGCSMLLWVADGSEILVWDGNWNHEIEWGRYIGFANEDKFGHTDKNDPRVAKLYRPDACSITYADLRFIVAAFKRIAAEKFGLRMEVGATFDAGPEFAYSDFKYKLHPEINHAELGGKEVALKADYTVICTWSKLREDRIAYAAYPEGIPEGTPFGEFLGRQCASFLPELGFDYIWFSNGFGFSYFPWTYLGANYDGASMPLANHEELTGRTLSFWEHFKRECPGYRTEVRGTNFGTGMDLAKDFVPLAELYKRKYIEYPPPNSPWGALNFDFGLEMASHMSRIAVLPGDTYPYRFYPNDPWFWQNPWRDLYDREPHDIYCPLTVARMNGDAELENPGIIELLTIDTEKGELNADCPAEIIPHLSRAIQDFPDQAGILTWLYPFKEYHEAVAASENEAKTIFFEEWFVRNAINQGLPLNTVLSTDEFAVLTGEGRSKLRETIVFAPASGLIGENARLLSSFVQEGGKAIIYGAVVDPQWQDLLNIRQVRGLEGELELASTLRPDMILGDVAASRIFKHDPLIGGGTLNEILDDADDRHTKVCATATQDDQVRILALTRELPEWNGGKVGWVRGALPFEGGEVTQLPVRQPDGYSDISILVRLLLAEFGYELNQIKHEETNKPALLFVSRHDNGFYFTGCRQDTSVALSMRFPDGVPIITGQTIRAGQGAAAYSLDRTYHEECRIFVDQRETTTVFCREYMPVPTPRKSSIRFIHVTGLREATVTIYPPLASLIAGNVEVRADHAYLDLKDCVFGDKLVITNISGEMEVTW